MGSPGLTEVRELPREKILDRTMLSLIIIIP